MIIVDWMLVPCFPAVEEGQLTACPWIPMGEGHAHWIPTDAALAEEWVTIVPVGREVAPPGSGLSAYKRELTH